METLHHIVQICIKLLNFYGHIIDASATLDFVSYWLLVEQL